MISGNIQYVIDVAFNIFKRYVGVSELEEIQLFYTL